MPVLAAGGCESVWFVWSVVNKTAPAARWS